MVSTEPTDCQIYRGQRGRMEIRVDVQGVSCHGSAPERGDNAIFKMGPILNELQELSHNLGNDEFLGKGTLTVSEIFFTSPSRCAVADSCAVSIDRRLTWGETWEGALDEIRALPAVQKAGAVVSMYNYERPSWTGLVYPTECYFPTWKVEEDHSPYARSAALMKDCSVKRRWSINGPSPPTAFPSWAATASRLSVSGQVKSRKPMRQMKNLETASGDLCRNVRRNPAELAGHRVSTIGYSSRRASAGVWSFYARTD